MTDEQEEKSIRVLTFSDVRRSQNRCVVKGSTLSRYLLVVTVCVSELIVSLILLFSTCTICIDWVLSSWLAMGHRRSYRRYLITLSLDLD